MTDSTEKQSATEKAKSRWGTQAGSGKRPEYDRREFYIESTNRHNHWTTARTFSPKAAEEMEISDTVTLPPEMLAQIHKVVEDPQTAYRSIQDFFRDAAHHRIHDVTEMLQDNNFLPFFNDELYRQQLLKIKREDEGFEVRMETWNSLVEEYFDDRNPHGIADIIEAVKGVVPPLRLRKRWVGYLNQWERRRDEAERLS